MDDINKVSVIIPIYGVEKYIERCARSLFQQTMKTGIEFIFVNDATIDNSMEILGKVISEFPERKDQIKIINHKENRGLAAGRKTGIKSASGEYIIHCDSDDWVEPDIYQSLYNAALENKSDMVICDYYVNFDESEKIISQNIPADKNLILNNLLAGNIHNNVWSKLIRRSIYEKLKGGYEEGINMWEDVSVISRLAYYCNNISYVPKPLYHYSQINSNAYTQKWKPLYTDNILRAVDLNRVFFKDKGISTKFLEQRAYLSILSHTKGEERKKYLRNFKKDLEDEKVYYANLSLYGKVLAWCLFNSHNILANNIMALKKILVKLGR